MAKLLHYFLTKNLDGVMSKQSSKCELVTKDEKLTVWITSL